MKIGVISRKFENKLAQLMGKAWPKKDEKIKE